MRPVKNVIYTIGHSNHSWQRFVELLNPHRIELLVDVRSNPYSRFAPWSNRKKLEPGLNEHGIDYIWMGEELGGMPRGPRARSGVEVGSEGDWYRTRSKNPGFLNAIAEISQLAMGKRLVLMCSEGDPANCHRTLMLAPAFLTSEFQIRHILPKSVGSAVEMPL